MLEKMKIVVSYKDMIRRLVIRDLRGRYKGSVFGFLWNLINPLAQIIVYTIVFSFFFQKRDRKILFVFRNWNDSVEYVSGIPDPGNGKYCR